MKKSFNQIVIITIEFLLLITANQSFAQYLSNGSFEIHRVGQYPIGHTGNGKYNEGQLMKCINMCIYDQYPNILFPPSTCFKENGWYSPTTASPDYYHVLGEYDNLMKEVYSFEYSFIKGENLIIIPAKNLSSGVYYLNANINEKIVTQKIIIIK